MFRSRSFRDLVAFWKVLLAELKRMRDCEIELLEDYASTEIMNINLTN